MSSHFALLGAVPQHFLWCRLYRLLGKRQSVLMRVLLESRSCWPHLFGIAALSLDLPPPHSSLSFAAEDRCRQRARQSAPFPVWLKATPLLHTRGASLEAAVAVLLGIALLVSIQSLAAWWLQT